MWTKESLNPNLDNLIIKLSHFGEWVQIVTSRFDGITKSGFITWGREKIVHWCILFYLSKYYSLFLFSLFFHFQLSMLIALVTIMFPLMGIVLIFTKSSSRDFSFLPLLLTNHFCLLQTPLRDAHYPFARMGLTSTTSRHAQCFLSLPLPIPQQFLSIFILPSIFLSFEG